MKCDVLQWFTLTLGAFCVARCTSPSTDLPECSRKPSASFIAGRQRPADILLVVDNSGWMLRAQQAAALAVPSLLHALPGLDLQIGIITTDTSTTERNDRGESVGVFTSRFQTSTPFALEQLDYSECRFLGLPHGCFHGGDATRVFRSLDHRVDDGAILLAETIRDVGVCGDDTERGLKAPILALSMAARDQCNEGFLRPNSRLIIIIISNSDDSDSQIFDTYFTALAQYKPLSDIRFAFVVGAVEGEASECGVNTGSQCGTVCSDPPAEGSLQACNLASPSCPDGEYCAPGLHICRNKELEAWDSCSYCYFYNAPDCCEAKPAHRYIEFAHAFERHVAAELPEIGVHECLPTVGMSSICLVESVCQESMNGVFDRIAQSIIIDKFSEDLERYTLDPPARNRDQIIVRLDGVVLDKADYAVVDDGTSLELSPGVAPAGSRIDIYCHY